MVALGLLPLIAAGLRLGGLRRVQSSLGRVWPAPMGSLAEADSLARARKAARIVSIVARRGPFKASCLPIALTLQCVLQGEGIGADLRLGVRRCAGRIEAHAWLEHFGTPLVEDCESHATYRAFGPIAWPGGR
jgi:hypothetical protein